MSKMEQTRIAKAEREIERLRDILRQLVLMLNAEPGLSIDYFKALPLDD